MGRRYTIELLKEMADRQDLSFKVHQAFHEFCGGTHKPTTHKQLNLFKEFIEFYVQEGGD